MTGTLNSTGLNTVTQGALNGVSAPNSTLGTKVSETVGVVGGLLGGKH